MNMKWCKIDLFPCRNPHFFPFSIPFSGSIAQLSAPSIAAGIPAGSFAGSVIILANENEVFP
jgi:hypothetical protein